MFEFINDFQPVNGVYRLSQESAPGDAIECYMKARKIEGRLYSDEIVRSLPLIERRHRYANEWRIRSASSRRLLNYLDGLPKPLTILDIGCGNGWLANRMALLSQCSVAAVDLNIPELEQGARVFHANDRLRFVYADIFEKALPPASFDVAIIAGASQYFPSLKELIGQVLTFLSPRSNASADGGEVHIVDSPLYRRGEIAAAQKRSREYYKSLGVPEMSKLYHHHSINDLENFGATTLYNPSSSIRLLQRRLPWSSLSPFPWIRIRRR